MSSQSATIADAIASALSGATLSKPITVERAWAPLKELGDMVEGTVYVTVVPRTRDITQAHRSGENKTYTVDIGVQVKLADALNATVDPYAALAEEVADLFRPGALGSTGAVYWPEKGHEPICNAQYLREMAVFFSLVTVRYIVTA
jgi:hypothetical protein